jgi:hypothetical protein
MSASIAILTFLGFITSRCVVGSVNTVPQNDGVELFYAKLW